jgi:FG-GAP-like repeat
MVTQRVWAYRVPVALTAMAATVGTVLAGGAAYAAPAPDPSGAAAKAQAAIKVADAIRRERAEQPTRNAATLATGLATLGDIDGDGRTDLTAIDSTGKLFVYPGKGVVYSGTGPRPTSYFSARYQAGTGWNALTALVRFGDWNNDGHQDILGRDSTGRLRLYAGTGTKPGIVRNAKQVGTGWNIFKSIVGIGDADNDGFDDLMGRRADGTLTIYFGTGNIAAPFRKQTVTGGSSWVGDLLTATGDWTADGNTEFMFRRYDQQIWLYRGSSSGFPANHPTLVFAAEDGPYVQNLVGMGNLTSDTTIDGVPVTQPTPDVIVQGVDGFLYLLGVDVGDDFDAVIGRGWSTYRTF